LSYDSKLQRVRIHATAVADCPPTPALLPLPLPPALAPPLPKDVNVAVEFAGPMVRKARTPKTRLPAALAELAQKPGSQEPGTVDGDKAEAKARAAPKGHGAGTKGM